ncbi:MAG: hypothetical protein AABX40_05095 [Candidatus Hydrothermarchaeota archaeon]
MDVCNIGGLSCESPFIAGQCKAWRGGIGACPAKKWRSQPKIGSNGLEVRVIQRL